MAKPDAIRHFLLVYDRANGRQLSVEEFGSNVEASLERYLEVEREYADNPRMDIVLVGSDSLETVKITHASYFADAATTVAQVEDYLRRFTESAVTGTN